MRHTSRRLPAVRRRCGGETGSSGRAYTSMTSSMRATNSPLLCGGWFRTSSDEDGAPLLRALPIVEFQLWISHVGPVSGSLTLTEVIGRLALSHAGQVMSSEG